MPCKIIAEVGQAHDGSLGTAHAYVDAAAKAGADGVKFQTHIASAESTHAESWRVRFSWQDTTRYDYWRRMEFTEPQWVELRDHARDVGLEFLSSPFSIESVELLQRVGVDAWKVASGEVSNLPLLNAIVEDGRPVILSSGMSPMTELDMAVELVRRRNIDLVVLQCTSAYPTPPEQLGLNMIEQLRHRYGLPTGLSDHSGTTYAGLAAATLGIDLLEVHVTFSRECFGPDVAASVTLEELRYLVEGIRFIEVALSSPVDKEKLSDEFAPMRELFTKSVVARRDLPAGTVLTPGDLVTKKPGTGLPPAEIPSLIGRTLMRSIAADEQLAVRDLESGP